MFMSDLKDSNIMDRELVFAEVWQTQLHLGYAEGELIFSKFSTILLKKILNAWFLVRSMLYIKLLEIEI